MTSVGGREGSGVDLGQVSVGSQKGRDVSDGTREEKVLERDGT